MINIINISEDTFLPEKYLNTSANSMDLKITEAKDLMDIAKIFDGSRLVYRQICQDKIHELEEYLAKIVNDQSNLTGQDCKMDDKVFLAKAKAKEYFKNSAYEMIRLLKKKLEDDLACQFLSSNYVNQLVNKTKVAILCLFNKLNDNISKECAAQEEVSPEEKKDQKSEMENRNMDNENEDGEDKVKPVKKINKKGKIKIPKKALALLKNWLIEHFNDPYPDFKEKARLAKEGGITFKQVQNWFTNARGRIWRKSCSEDNFESLMEEKLVENERKKFEIFQNEKNYLSMINPQY